MTQPTIKDKIREMFEDLHLESYHEYGNQEKGIECRFPDAEKELLTLFEQEMEKERKSNNLAIKFAIATLKNIPTGLFDSTPYVEKQIESLEDELVRIKE